MKVRFLLCLTVISHLLSHAQVVIQSPEVAELNRYLDFPVDKSTGAVSVDIPIYTINTGSFSLPISLSYHTGGIRVDAMATEVGLGWSLMIGGKISRTVRVLPDEGGYLANNGFSVEVPAIGAPTHFSIGDSEPDIFSYNVGGYAGKFVFDKNGSIHLVPEQDIKIEVESAHLLTLGRFKITTPDGTIYYFEGKYDTYELYDVGNPGYDPNLIPTAWHLFKITTLSGEDILFEYQDDGFETRKNSADAVYALSTNGACAECYTRPLRYRMHSHAITRIHSDNVDIGFFYKGSSRQDIYPLYGNSKALEEIQIKDKFFSTIIKRIKLTTSYFESNDNIAVGQNYGSNSVDFYTVESYLRKRLKLDEVQEYGSDGGSLPPYKFFYNKFNPVAKSPNRLSNGQDHWGFYNGISTNRCLIGNYSWPSQCQTSVYLANRSVNHQYNKAFILDEIVFPTGGKTIYHYDNLTSQQIPGVRIIRVEKRTGESVKAGEISYQYYNPYLTGGGPIYAQLYESLYHPTNPLSQEVQRTGTISIRDPICLTELNKFGTPYIAFNSPANYSGELASNHVYYERVSEIQKGSGRTEYYFDVQDVQDYILDIDVYPWVISKPLLKAGKLIRELNLNEAGMPVHEIIYEYDYYYRKIISTEDNARQTSQPCSQTLKFYPLYTGHVFLKKKEETFFRKFAPYSSLNQEFTNVTHYDYGGIPEPYKNYQWQINPDVDYGIPVHHFLTSQEVSNSDGTKRITTYKYPTDFSTVPVFSQMINRFQINYRVETIRYNEEIHVQSNKTNFNNWGSFIAPHSIEERRKESLYEPRLIYDSYNGKIGLLSYHKSQAPYTSCLWGYNESYPVITVENSDLQTLQGHVASALVELGFVGGLQDLDDFLVQLGALKTSGQKSIWIQFINKIKEKYSGQTVTISLAAYSPLVGVVSEAKGGSFPIYYEYDQHGRLILVRDSDDNIIKSVCYGYSGQVVNCN